MKSDWFVANVTRGVTPDRAERSTKEMILDISLANSGYFCGREARL